MNYILLVESKQSFMSLKNWVKGGSSSKKVCLNTVYLYNINDNIPLKIRSFGYVNVNDEFIIIFGGSIVLMIFIY